MKYRWVNRVAPPFIIATAAGCAWYVWRNHSAPIAYGPVTDGQVSAVASAAPAPKETPSAVNTVITKQGSDLQFSLQTLPYKDVQRVEFYVENQLVGAAYTAPYSISVKASDLAAGPHTATAKIVTQGTTTATVPATFTTPSLNQTTPPTPTNTKPVVISTPAAKTVAAPSNVAATVGTDGNSVVLTWNASDGAVQYQIWRDGSQIAIVADTSYTDTSLTASQSYAYQIVAEDSTNAISGFSDAVSVTMPSSATSVTPAPTMQSQSSQPAQQNASTDDQPAQ